MQYNIASINDETHTYYVLANSHINNMKIIAFWKQNSRLTQVNLLDDSGFFIKKEYVVQY